MQQVEFAEAQSGLPAVAEPRGGSFCGESCSLLRCWRDSRSGSKSGLALESACEKLWLLPGSGNEKPTCGAPQFKAAPPRAQPGRGAAPPGGFRRLAGEAGGCAPAPLAKVLWAERSSAVWGLPEWDWELLVLRAVLAPSHFSPGSFFSS